MKRERLNDNQINLWLDSGAFSCWMKGETITVEEYIKYIKRYKEYIANYVVLDVIPGIPSRAPTAEESDIGARATYSNYCKMRDAGLDPIPVYHQGEDWKWLEKYLVDEEVDYIGVSCDKQLDASTRRLRLQWLDRIFTRVTNEEGEPLVKIHGFAITSIPLMYRYPFYSCDSTTWSLIGSYGFILCPVYVAGIPDYSREPEMVHISDRTSLNRVTAKHGRVNAKNFAGKGKKYEEFGPMIQARIRHFIEEECGQSLTSVRYDDNARRWCTIIFFQKLSKFLEGNKFKHRVSGV